MDLLTLLGFSFTALTIFTVYLLIKVPNAYRLKWLAIPLLICLGTQFAFRLPDVLGLPKESYPVDEFKLIAFKPVFINNKIYIQAWVTENGQSRLYQFHYSEETMQRLTSLMAHGGHGKAKRRGQTNVPGEGGTDADYEIVGINPPTEDLPSKNQTPTT